MGKHRNRVRIYDSDGNFLGTVSPPEAQHMLDFGEARQTSAEGERPLRIRLNPCQRGVRDNRDAFPRTLPGSAGVQEMADSIEVQKKLDLHLNRKGWADVDRTATREAEEEAQKPFMEKTNILPFEKLKKLVLERANKLP